MKSERRKWTKSSKKKLKVRVVAKKSLILDNFGLANNLEA